jgi:hypothetical protein
MEGVFNSKDAKEILLSFICYKIQYHNLKIFGEEERSGVKNEHSAIRIEQLQEVRKQILRLIKESEHKNKKLEISSTITIRTIE